MPKASGQKFTEPQIDSFAHNYIITDELILLAFPCNDHTVFSLIDFSNKPDPVPEPPDVVEGLA